MHNVVCLRMFVYKHGRLARIRLITNFSSFSMASLTENGLLVLVLFAIYYYRPQKAPAPMLQSPCEEPSDTRPRAPDATLHVSGMRIADSQDGHLRHQQDNSVFRAGSITNPSESASTQYKVAVKVEQDNALVPTIHRKFDSPGSASNPIR